MCPVSPRCLIPGVIGCRSPPAPGQSSALPLCPSVHLEVHKQGWNKFEWNRRRSFFCHLWVALPYLHTVACNRSHTHGRINPIKMSFGPPLILWPYVAASLYFAWSPRYQQGIVWGDSILDQVCSMLYVKLWNTNLFKTMCPVNAALTTRTKVHLNLIDTTSITNSCKSKISRWRFTKGHLG